MKLEVYIVAKRRLKSHLTTNLHLQLLVVTDYTFLQFFQQYGEVVDSIVLLDRRTKRSRGFGFVTFADEVSSIILSCVLSLLQMCTNHLT